MKGKKLSVTIPPPEMGKCSWDCPLNIGSNSDVHSCVFGYDMNHEPFDKHCPWSKPSNRKESTDIKNAVTERQYYFAIFKGENGLLKNEKLGLLLGILAEKKIEHMRQLLTPPFDNEKTLEYLCNVRSMADIPTEKLRWLYELFETHKNNL